MVSFPVVVTLVASASIRASSLETSLGSRRENFGRLNTSRYSAKMASETNISTARKATNSKTRACRPEGLRAARQRGADQSAGGRVPGSPMQ